MMDYLKYIMHNNFYYLSITVYMIEITIFIENTFFIYLEEIKKLFELFFLAFKK